MVLNSHRKAIASVTSDPGTMQDVIRVIQILLNLALIQ
jgi:hypothetical protein